MIVRCFLVVCLTLFLGACAHPISIAPDLGAVPEQKASVQKNVAYVITTANRDREVTTPGGGGDAIRYFPYRELEAGIFKALSAIYNKVTLLRSADDKSGVENSGASFVFLPTISTDSSSTSIITWPPTHFLITIKYEAKDATGKVLYSNQVLGTGEATFDEFKSDFGLAGKRAARDVLLKFKEQVEKAKELK